jgi:hypothetical protein
MDLSTITNWQTYAWILVAYIKHFKQLLQQHSKWQYLHWVSLISLNLKFTRDRICSQSESLSFSATIHWISVTVNLPQNLQRCSISVTSTEPSVPIFQPTFTAPWHKCHNSHLLRDLWLLYLQAGYKQNGHKWLGLTMPSYNFIPQCIPISLYTHMVDLVIMWHIVVHLVQQLL